MITYILTALLCCSLTFILTYLLCKSSFSKKILGKDEYLNQNKLRINELENDLKVKEDKISDLDFALKQSNEEMKGWQTKTEDLTELNHKTELILSTKDSQIKALEEKFEAEKLSAENKLKQTCEFYEKRLVELKENNKEILESTKKELALENEKILQQKQEALKNEAERTMKTITEGLDKSVKEMKESFESQKKAHSEDSAKILTEFAQTCRNFKEQSENIGNKADNLANALRGSNKMQGNWGERILENIFEQEGLIKGRDYDKEEYLRDENGTIVINEDTNRRMRPDYIIHMPDNTDIIIDCKMNLDAYVDWKNAENEEDRSNAAKRNLQAVKSQIDTLTSRKYEKYLRSGKKTINFTIMYIANYGALALAKELQKNIVNEAFKCNVLITTEETLMPFLNLIKTAWIRQEQIKNQEKIIKAAELMINRVGDYCEAHSTVGKKLREAMDAHEKASVKLQEKGHSIINSANEIKRLGVEQTNNKLIPLIGD